MEAPKLKLHAHRHALETLGLEEFSWLHGHNPGDVSFISATRIVPVMAATLKPDSGEMVVLVKPQFEVARGMVGEGGIVRDPLLHEECCQKVRACVEQLDFETDIMESPITGAEGNKEFLLYGRRITNNSQN